MNALREPGDYWLPNGNIDKGEFIRVHQRSLLKYALVIIPKIKSEVLPADENLINMAIRGPIGRIQSNIERIIWAESKPEEIPAVEFDLYITGSAARRSVDHSRLN